MIFEKKISKEKENLHLFYSGNPKKEGLDNKKLEITIDKIFTNNYF